MEVPRRLIVLIEGESLVNDGTGLVAYRTAVAAAVGGSFSLLEPSGDVVAGVVGGAAVGVVIAQIRLDTQRRELVLPRDTGPVSDEVVHALVRELDLEDQRLEIWRSRPPSGCGPDGLVCAGSSGESNLFPPLWHRFPRASLRDARVRPRGGSRLERAVNARPAR